MRSGLLRHRVTLETFTLTQNEYGEPVQGWATLATVNASKEDLSGREFFAAQQTNAEVTTRFAIRWRSDVNATVRVKHGTTLYNVVAVQDPDGRGRELHVLAKKVG